MFVIAWLVVGCATSQRPQPLTFDCLFLQMSPVSNPGQRVEVWSWGGTAFAYLANRLLVDEAHERHVELHQVRVECGEAGEPCVGRTQVAARLDNVVLAPHAAGSTLPGKAGVGNCCARSILAIARGEAPPARGAR
jgi:hypothetical protein